MIGQRKIISASSWGATAIVVALGLWLGSRYGPVAQWTVLIAILVLVTTAGVWMRHKAVRQRLEFQESIHELAKGKSIDDLMIQYPEFLSTMRRLPKETLQAVFEVLDENQVRDLRKALQREA